MPTLRILVTISLLCNISKVRCDAAEKCVMEGPCEEGDYGDLNCYRERSPSPLNDAQAVGILRNLCGELVTEGDDSAVCCGAEQVKTLRDNFATASALLGRCPACFENFKRFFCHFTCSPHQAKFVNVTRVQQKEGKLTILEASFYINTEFAESVYKSCRNVQGLTPGSKAIELMCGVWGRDCDPIRWLDFMGSTPENGGFSPFQINIHMTSSSAAFTTDALLCSEAAGDKGVPCACVDCPDSCSRQHH